MKLKPLDILFITPFVPYPLSEGGKISQFASIDYLRRTQNVSILLTIKDDKDFESVNELEKKLGNVKIYKIDLRANKHQSFLRNVYVKMLKLKFLIAHLVKNTNKSNHQKDSYYELEDPYFLSIYTIKDKELLEQVIHITTVNKFDIIQVDFIQFVDLIFALPAAAKKVFVHHEIRFMRLLTSFYSKETIINPYFSYKLKYVKSQELEILKQYDALFVFSKEDKQKLRDELPFSKINVTPFPILDEHFLPVQPESLTVHKLLFIGGEGHYPNKEGVEWFIEEMMPFLFKKFNIPLHVIGEWSEQTKNKFKREGIKFTGFVDDIREYGKNSIMVVPIRIGSGIRTKVLYSMAQGIPVISTKVGSEGIELAGGESVLFAETLNEFSDGIHKIITSPEFTLRMVSCAQQLVSTLYSQQKCGDLRLKYYNELLDINKQTNA